MGLREERPFAFEEFVKWNEVQELDYELVDGRAVMMVGGAPSHSDIASSIVQHLGPQTRKQGCKTTSSDLGVRTGVDQMRYPDVLVRCGREPTGQYHAEKPKVVVEVLSPSTEWHDNSRKLKEYQAVATIDVILIVSPRRIAVDTYRRGADGVWTMVQHTNRSDVIDLSGVGASLPLATIYDDIDLDPPELRVVD